MTKTARLLFLVAISLHGVAEAQDRISVPISFGQALGQVTRQLEQSCKAYVPAEVVVCGRSRRAYRIDANVLAEVRSADAARPKPAIDTAATDHCVGPHCGGDTIPLVQMALTAVKAAALAAEGDDWRDAFRTHPDSYQAYQQSRAVTQRSGK